ncbi:MAG TPA: serine/threonine-protein kinase, partial [Pirellulaceae bacterium]|nr:serine/threonine-protein kinase [Pirellulaceae bacterium]
MLDDDPIWNSPRPARLPEIAGYEVLERVSQGGMGVIFKARHLGLNRSVALKMIATPLAADAEVQARFRNEIAALARLHHPHVVQIFDVGEADGHAYFAMEYVDGPNLAKVIGGRPQPPRLAARLAVCLARTIADVHSVGLLHRDLKPGNVLLAPPAGLGRSDTAIASRDSSGKFEARDGESHVATSSEGAWSAQAGEGELELAAGTRHLAVGTPKIGDFGLALALDADSRLTRTGSLGGTPQYVAPEQLHGAPESLTVACDIYSLGAVLYEMLTGRPPFTGHSPHEIARQVAEAEPLAPRRLQPHLPLDLETIVLKCLRKSPEQRYASATELAEDLDRYLAGLPILARPVRLAERVLRWLGQRPRKAIIGGVATLAFAALTADFVRQKAEWKETLEDVTSERDRARRSERTALSEVRELRQANSLLDAQLRDSKQLIDSTARRLRTVVPSTSFGEAYLNVRREVLEAVSDYHSRFAARFPAGSNTTLEHARASLLLAELRCDEGRYEEAHELLTEAAEHFNGELRRNRFEAT